MPGRRASRISCSFNHRRPESKHDQHEVNFQSACFHKKTTSSYRPPAYRKHVGHPLLLFSLQRRFGGRSDRSPDRVPAERRPRSPNLGGRSPRARPESGQDHTGLGARAHAVKRRTRRIDIRSRFEIVDGASAISRPRNREVARFVRPPRIMRRALVGILVDRIEERASAADDEVGRSKRSQSMTTFLG